MRTVTGAEIVAVMERMQRTNENAHDLIEEQREKITALLLGCRNLRMQNEEMKRRLAAADAARPAMTEDDRTYAESLIYSAIMNATTDRMNEKVALGLTALCVEFDVVLR